MTQFQRVACSDGVVRWSRIHLRKEKPSHQDGMAIPVEVQQFEDLFVKLSEQFLGQKTYFCCKGWTKKKLRYILNTLENLSAHHVEPELFLLSAFSRQREEPRAIWPSSLSSLRAIKKFQEWLSAFASKKEARRHLEPVTLERILEQNHKKYLYYHEQIGWSDEIIFRTKAVEFDPFYLVSVPAFIQEYEKHPEALRSVRGRLEEAIGFLERDSFAAKKFWDIVGRIKCQTQQNNSTSFSRAR